MVYIRFYSHKIAFWTSQYITYFRTYLDRDLRYSLSLRQIVDNHRVGLPVAVSAAKRRRYKLRTASALTFSLRTATMHAAS